MTTASYRRPVRLVGWDPLRDKSYQQTRLGRSVVDFLAWLEIGGAAEATLDQYERDLARGALMYPRKGLADLEDGDLLQIALAFPAAGRPKRMAAWRSMYRWAIKTRKVRFNPCEALPEWQRTPQQVYEVFTDSEIALLCGLPVRDGALMQLLFDAGLRRAEAGRFQLADLRASGHRNEVVVRKGKRSKGRVIPATRELAQRINELALLEGLENSDHLWYGVTRTPHLTRVERTDPIGHGTFQRWWDRCLDHADVRRRNPHMTRHTFATRYLRKGGRLERLQEAMGHKSIQTTKDLYGHLDLNDLHDDFERIFAPATD